MQKRKYDQEIGILALESRKDHIVKWLREVGRFGCQHEDVDVELDPETQNLSVHMREMTVEDQENMSRRLPRRKRLVKKLEPEQIKCPLMFEESLTTHTVPSLTPSIHSSFLRFPSKMSMGSKADPSAAAQAIRLAFFRSCDWTTLADTREARQEISRNATQSSASTREVVSQKNVPLHVHLSKHCDP